MVRTLGSFWIVFCGPVQTNAYQKDNLVPKQNSFRAKPLQVNKISWFCATQLAESRIWLVYVCFWGGGFQTSMYFSLWFQIFLQTWEVSQVCRKTCLVLWLWTMDLDIHRWGPNITIRYIDWWHPLMSLFMLTLDKK